MQPPAITLTAENAARTTLRRPRCPRDRTRASASGGMPRLDRRDHPAFLERERGLRHDGFVAVQSGLHVDRSPEVPTQHHWLKMQFVSRADDGDPGALPVEDDGGGWHAPAGARRCDLERYIDEHAGQQSARLAGGVDLRQERTRAGIEGAGGSWP